MHRLFLLLVAAAVAAAWLALARGDSGPTASTYSLVARQAQEVSVAVQFVNAFNAHRLRTALALLTPDAVGSDCDYRRVEAIQFSGKAGFRTWLHRRFADHDYLGLARVFNENPGQPIGVAGLDYSRRSSDTLRALGFPHGIKPLVGTKVVFNQSQPTRIRGFNNGPVGGSRELCRPR